MQENEEALKVMDELKKVKDSIPSGRYTYAMARINAQLGNKDLAVELIKKAMTGGFVNEYGQFKYGEDIDLLPLKGILSFEYFIL